MENLPAGGPTRNNPAKHFFSIEPSRQADYRVYWEEVARTAWLAPSWREAAITYHKDRPASPAPSASKLMPSEREIWRAAGQCIRRKAAHDALRTFWRWCDRNGVDRNDALPIFRTIVDRELAK
jgi:hypothetical protein